MSVAPCCCTTCLLAWTVLHALRREAGIVNIFPPSGWRMAVVLIRRSCSGCCCTDKEEKTQQHPGINTKSAAAVARGAAEVALGALVAPPAAVSEVEGRADD